MSRSIGSDTSVVTPVDEKDQIGTQVVAIKSNESIPKHPTYYEKGGLRTYGDDEDHDHEPPVNTFSLMCNVR